MHKTAADVSRNALFEQFNSGIITCDDLREQKMNAQHAIDTAIDLVTLQVRYAT